MSKKGTHHVVKSPDGGWDVKKGGASRKSGHFETKKEAAPISEIMSYMRKWLSEHNWANEVERQSIGLLTRSPDVANKNSQVSNRTIMPQI